MSSSALRGFLARPHISCEHRRFSLAGDEVEPMRFETALGFRRFKATGARIDPLAAILRGQAAQGKQLLRIGARSRRHRLLPEA